MRRHKSALFREGRIMPSAMTYKTIERFLGERVGMSTSRAVRFRSYT